MNLKYVEWQLMTGTFSFFVVSIWLKELVQLCTGLLLAPIFGFKLNRFSLFGLGFTKEDGAWKCSRGTPSILIQSLITVDLTKSYTPEEIEKKEKQFETLRILILFAVSGAIMPLCFQPILHVINHSASVPDAFLAGLGIGMCWHSLAALLIRLYVYGIMMKKLSGYVQTLTNRLRAGERFSVLGLRPIEELPYQNPTQIEKMLYYSYYLSAMLEQGEIGALQKPTREMTSYFRERDYILQNTWHYYWLIFYYSRYELNPMLATHFLNKVRNTIENDKDVNAKRVLAYYAFGIEQNFSKSRMLADEAYAVLEKFPTEGERELERKLLAELDSFLRMKGF